MPAGGKGGSGRRGPTGTVYQMLATGEVTVLHQFVARERAGGYVDGGKPLATLTQVGSDTLLGVTEQGGDERVGTLFKLTAP